MTDGRIEKWTDGQKSDDDIVHHTCVLTCDESTATTAAAAAECSVSKQCDISINKHFICGIVVFIMIVTVQYITVVCSGATSSVTHLLKRTRRDIWQRIKTGECCVICRPAR